MIAYDIEWIYNNGKKHSTLANTLDMAIMKAEPFICDENIIHIEISHGDETISPHVWMTKEQLNVYRTRQRKRTQAAKNERLDTFRAMSTLQLIDICEGCYKNCPCEEGLLRDQVLQERKRMVQNG